MAFKYAQPFLISRTVDFSDNLDESDDIGWGLTGAWLLVFIGLAASSPSQFYSIKQLLTNARSQLEPFTT